MHIEYKGLNQDQFDKLNNKRASTNKNWKQYLRQLLPGNARTFALERLPILKLAKSYRFKDYFLNDFFSGLSVALMAIPQSFGYARIASIPEIIGLYTSFFPVVIYFIFTTSTHVSLGTMALTSLLIGSAINSLNLPSGNVYETNSTSDVMSYVGNVSSDLFSEIDFKAKNDEIKILMTVSLSCAASLILLVMSLFKMGFIVSFMSDAFISGFLAASTLRVLVIQVKDIFGIHPEHKHRGFCEFFRNAYELFFEIRGINLIQVGMSVIALVILLSVKEFINKRYKDKLKIPIPIEIIVVIISIILTKVLGLERNFNVEVSNGMKSGLPSLVVPSFELMYKNAITAFLLALICFMMVGMMAKLFAQNHGYHVDDNQEMFAIGLAGVLGSFFCSMIPSTSPPRCFLAESTGAKSQLAHLFSALFAFLSMLAFASLLRDLPVCILACIIIVACLPLLPHFLKFYPYWLSNKYDFSVWCVTFATVLLFSVETGMLVGVSYSLLMVHVWMKKNSRGFILERTFNGLYLASTMYSVKSEGTNDSFGLEGDIDGRIKVFKFESSLYFSTIENFKASLFSHVPSYTRLKKMKSVPVKSLECSCFKKSKQTKTSKDVQCEIETNVNMVLAQDDRKVGDQSLKINKLSLQSEANESNLKVVIVDCSCMPFCDSSGAEFLAQTNLKYLSVGVDFCLASCNENFINQLKSITACRKLVQDHLYPSIYDAYLVSVKKFTPQEVAISIDDASCY